MSSYSDTCKMDKIRSQCEKFMKLKNQHPNSIITCESKWELTREGKKIGSCSAKITEENINHYKDQGRRADGSCTGGHIDSFY